VTNDGSSNALDSDSMIHIEWDVVTLDTIQNNTEYWVSAGAEYTNKDDIWIGQAGFMSLLDDYNNVSTVLSSSASISTDINKDATLMATKARNFGLKTSFNITELLFR